MYKNIATKTVIVFSLLSASNMASASKDFYIGAEYGTYAPLSKKFKIDNVDVKAAGGSVKGVRIGYQFHPNMFVDFSYNTRSGVKMSAAMDQGLPAGVRLAWGSAKLRYDSYILSVRYAMPNGSKFTPYAGFGVGAAKVGVKHQDKVYVNIPPFVHPVAGPLAFNGHSGTVIKKSKLTPAFRLYAGADTKVTEFLSIYLDTKIEVTKKVPVKFEVDNPFTQQLDMTKTVKTKMGVAEAVLGLRFTF